MQDFIGELIGTIFAVAVAGVFWVIVAEVPF